MLTNAPGVLALEEVQLGVRAVGAALRAILEPVVVIDHPGCDLSGVHGLQDGYVVLVDQRVPLEAGQPLQPGGVAPRREHRADDRLEVSTTGGDAHPALPGRAGQVHDRLREVGGRHHRGVVDEGRSTAPAIPIQSPFAAENWAGTCAREAASSGANSPLPFTSAMAGLFSVMNTSAGERRTFLDDLVGQLEVAAGPDVDLDAGPRGEVLHPGLGERPVLCVVERQRVRVALPGPTTPDGGQGRDGHRDGGGRRAAEPARSHPNRPVRMPSMR